MQTETEKFDQWALVEIMGHRKLAGRVTEQTVGGAALLRVEDGLKWSVLVPKRAHSEHSGRGATRTAPVVVLPFEIGSSGGGFWRVT